MSDKVERRILGGLAPLLAMGAVWCLHKFDFFAVRTPTLKVFSAVLISVVIWVFGSLIINRKRKTG